MAEVAKPAVAAPVPPKPVVAAAPVPPKPIVKTVEERLLALENRIALLVRNHNITTGSKVA